MSTDIQENPPAATPNKYIFQSINRGLVYRIVAVGMSVTRYHWLGKQSRLLAGT